MIIRVPFESYGSGIMAVNFPIMPIFPNFPTFPIFLSLFIYYFFMYYFFIDIF